MPIPELLYVHTMTGLSPNKLEIADADPVVLKWDAFPGAARYRVDYDSKPTGRFQNFEVTVPRCEIRNTKAGEQYRWRVCAMGSNGQPLAGGFGYFFSHGTDPALVQRVRAEPASCVPLQPPKGPGYLGVVVSRTSEEVPEDARGVRRRLMFLAPADTKLVPAAFVMDVIPGSPAVDAGLRPGDVIIALDGRPIPAQRADHPENSVNFPRGDTAAFTKLIAAKPPGTTVILTVHRDSKELRITATIGKPPKVSSATTQPG